MIDAASFGEWLRKRRKAMDLTQGDLGRQLGLSTASIRKIENDERRPSREMVERIAREMHVPETEREAFTQFARAQVSAAPPEHRAPVANSAVNVPTALVPDTGSAEQPIWLRQRHLSTLPLPMTPLLGRDEEQRAVAALLLQADVRLVTLTGTGGTGKTRLALAVATMLREHFRGGALLVPLAPVQDPNFVLTAIAQALGLREAASDLDGSLLDALQDYLRPRQMLLLLDNFEQVIEAAPVVSALLSAAPNVKVIVTSRERLYLSAEYEWAVPPLGLPPQRKASEADAASPASAADVAALASYPAVALFVQRARAAYSSFNFNAANAAAIVEICRYLEGLPLAVELAAARAKVLSPPEILQHLRGEGAAPLNVLASRSHDLPARQQTIERMIDWSYVLLSEAEQRVFARLGIFANGSTLAAAQAVCADIPQDGDTLFDLLVSLVDKSLVQHLHSDSGEGRWRMLEIIRTFAYQRLVERGEADRTGERFADYILHLAEDVAPRLPGAEQGALLLVLDAEHPNIRAVLTALLDRGDHARARRLASALWLFWRQRGYWGEGRQWIERILEGEDVPDADAVPAVAVLLAQAGSLAVLQHDIPYAVAVSERAIALADTAGAAQWAQHATAWGYANLGVVALDRGDYDHACTDLQTSLDLFRTLDDAWGIATVLNNMGEVATTEGRYEQAVEWHTESLAVLRALGNEGTAAWPNLDIGRLRIIQNQLDDGRRRLDESLAIFRSLDDRWGIAWSLNHLAWALRMQGMADRARTALDESQRLFETLGDNWGSASSLEHSAWLALGAGDVTEAERQGRAALLRFRDIGNALAIFSASELLMAVAVAAARFEHAAHLAGAIEALRTSMGVPRLPIDQPQWERDAHRIAAASVDTTAALATGRVWDMQTLMWAALGDPTT